MQTALIVGGSRGIGAATVRAFTAAGYRTGFFYCASQEAADVLARETGAIPFPCDIANSAQVQQACGQALKQLGHIDALVVCAGIAQQKLFTDLTDDDWDRMLGVNLSGPFYVTRALLPGMLSRKAGQIVYLSSMWGQVGASMEVPYSAAKAGLIGMTKALAKEVAPSGIRVNCIAPGVIRTDMVTPLGEEALAALAEETPMGRLGTPEEIAGIALWLCGEDAAFITGQVIGASGGLVV